MGKRKSQFLLGALASGPRRGLLWNPVSEKPTMLVAVLMGSKSDWETMRHTAETLDKFGIAHECRVLSAHRTPAATAEYVSKAEERGFEVIIAAAGGAAHLAGVAAAHTVLPVLGVPIESASLKGLDSLLSTVQMPAGIPVGTLGIGKPGAINAALLAVAVLAASRPDLRAKLHAYRQEQARTVLETTVP
jgi:5-(carboxyamino)imidazole ribonucleotide mutase